MDDLRVLVVDDEPLSARGHAEYVTRVPGFVVAATVGTVREAIQTLSHGQIDLNLPDGHGLDIARAIRAGGRPVDILTITAGREVELVRAAVSLGVVGYLLKPFTFADLRERLAAYRRYREGIASTTTASQSGVDEFFRDLRRPLAAGGLPPKGLAGNVLDRVIELLRDAGPAGLSASEVSTALGMSRVTARRYLQYLADEGYAGRGQRVGGSGRPEVTFKWRE